MESNQSKDLSNDCIQVYTHFKGMLKCCFINPIIPSQSGTYSADTLYIIYRILSDAIRYCATYNAYCYLIWRRLIFWESAIQLTNLQILRLYKHVQISQHSVWNATGPNIFKPWLPAIRGCYLESTGCVVSNTSVTKDGVRVLTGGN